MKLIFFSILIGIFSTTTEGRLTQQFFPGSLSGAWSMKVKMNLKLFSGVLVYSTDYERNYLKLYTQKSNIGQNCIMFVYNNQKQLITIKSLCDCDPCHGRMMTLDIITLGTIVTLYCNSFGSYSITKVDTKNRVNPDIPFVIQQLTTIPNTMYTSVALDGRGCLDSFYFNRQKIQFHAMNRGFEVYCNDSCVKGLCNKGVCLRLENNVAQCDCRYTALNGPHCNESLKHYKLYSQNGYQLISGARNAFIKFSWEKNEDDRFCLLEFVHKYGRITFSHEHQAVLRDSEYLSYIQNTGINFISINITDSLATINVNNNASLRLILSGKVYINVGFSETRQHCDPFQGRYDFKYDPLQLRINDRVRFTPAGVTASPQNSEIHLRTILIGSGSAILLVIFFSLIAIIIYLRNHQVKQKPKGIDNIYYCPGDADHDVQQRKLINANLYDDLDYTVVHDEHNKGPEKLVIYESNATIEHQFNCPPLPPRSLDASN